MKDQIAFRSTDDVAILVPSWDGYCDTWKPFFRCFFKYWQECPYQVFLGSNSLRYSDRRVSTILIGDEVDYSSNLLAMLAHIVQERVIIWADDFLLAAPVDTTRIRHLIDMAQYEQAGYLRLGVPPNSITSLLIAGCRGMQICEMPRGSPYRVTVGLGLWNKHYLAKLLKPGETAWDFERNGARRSDDLPERVLCISERIMVDPVILCVDALWQGVWTLEAARFLTREGLADSIVTRPIQGFWSYVQLHLLQRMDRIRLLWHRLRRKWRRWSN